MLSTNSTLLSTIKSTQAFNERDIIKQLAKDLQKVADIQAGIIINQSGPIATASKIKQTEVNFGDTLFVNQNVFSILDSDVKSGSNIVASVAYVAPTGKDLDEIDMDSITCSAGSIADGSFNLLVTGSEGSLYGNFKINYTISWPS